MHRVHGALYRAYITHKNNKRFIGMRKGAFKRPSRAPTLLFLSAVALRRDVCLRQRPDERRNGTKKTGLPTVVPTIGPRCGKYMTRARTRTGLSLYSLPNAHYRQGDNGDERGCVRTSERIPSVPSVHGMSESVYGALYRAFITHENYKRLIGMRKGAFKRPSRVPNVLLVHDTSEDANTPLIAQ